MKKLTALLVAMLLCLSLVACGGGDKQPAIDAFNAANTVFTEVANVVNADPEAFMQEDIDTLVEMSDLLAQYKELLESSDPIPQENLDEMTAWLNDVEVWAGEVLAEITAE